jgi:hypothetical protein
MPWMMSMRLASLLIFCAARCHQMLYCDGHNDWLQPADCVEKLGFGIFEKI